MKHSPLAYPIVRTREAADSGNGGDRVVEYIFSTPEVARDGHTIQAWDLANFMRNPVFCWAHDTSEPPIGKVIDITQKAGVLTGSVSYATAEENPFADTIFRLVAGRFINATSVSWIPLSWSYSQDRSRPGGIDFKLADLLEISQVPVPSLPTALATARSAGLNLKPLIEWTERALDRRPRVWRRPGGPGRGCEVVRRPTNAASHNAHTQSPSHTTTAGRHGSIKGSETHT